MEFHILGAVIAEPIDLLLIQFQFSK